MGSVRIGVGTEWLNQHNKRIELADLARGFEKTLAQQRVLAEQSNPFIGALDQAALDRVQAADQAAAAGVGLTPRAARRKPRPVTASDYLGGRR